MIGPPDGVRLFDDAESGVGRGPPTYDLDQWRHVAGKKAIIALPVQDRRKDMARLIHRDTGPLSQMHHRRNVSD
jgi:hypothetical protein